jgi:hypothetical protein
VDGITVVEQHEKGSDCRAKQEDSDGYLVLLFL